MSYSSGWPYGDDLPRRRRRRSPVGVVSVVLIVLALFGIVAATVSYNTTHEGVTTVCEKERAAVQGGGAEYRIYASDGTYVMADSLLGQTRYDTADEYGKIQPNTTYKIVYKGWRIPFFSAFPNILQATPVPADQQRGNLCTAR